jgi:putative flippase GtrA
MVGRFIAVGVVGFVVQLAVLAGLTRLGAPWVAATVMAVEAAIVHNFVWHRSWTWRDRRSEATGLHWLLEFAKFNGGTAVTSLAGNLGVMAIVLSVVNVKPIVANIVAVAVMSAANFLLADRWVFRSAQEAAPSVAAKSSVIAGLVLLSATPSASAAPRAETLAAWDRYVGETEARLDREQFQQRAALASTLPASHPGTPVASGRSIDVGDGTITHWRGEILVPDISVDQLLDRLKHPGTPPPQDDITASRVLERSDDILTVYMRLIRRSLVTVSYDTEHVMRFNRWSADLATARSVATRMAEIGGDDHGFMWRLNSYWRYERVSGGVLVSLETLTLSRDVPWLLRPIAAPVTSSIARESMTRTLDALRRYLRAAAVS